MDIKKINKAVSILENSNRLLKGRMDELRHALEKSILRRMPLTLILCWNTVRLSMRRWRWQFGLCSLKAIQT